MTFFGAEQCGDLNGHLTGITRGGENEHVLGILRDRRVKMSELADHLGLDRSTISGLVDRAEKRGLVERAPNPIDGRAVDVVLTEAGMELAEVGGAEIAHALVPMTSALTRANADRLTAWLERMLGPVPTNL